MDSASSGQPRKLPAKSASVRVVDGFQMEEVSQEIATFSTPVNNLASLPVGDHTRSFLPPVYETVARSHIHCDGSDNLLAAADSDKAMSLLSLTSSSPSSSRSSTVFSGFLTMLGSRKPLRSTSFSNMTSSLSESSTSSNGATSGALSTSRPLRVYTRSSTDTELYMSSVERENVRSAPARRCQLNSN